MEETVAAAIHRMAKSHEELAKIIESKRHIVVHATQLIHVLPDWNPRQSGIDPIVDHSLQLAKSVTSFLNGLAELEEAIADNLELFMKELREESEE